jgi:hypothetical protein
MSRPIKYRAWANDKMHEVRAIGFTETGEVHRILDSEGVQRVPEALLQFTGFRDRKLREIYEDALVIEYLGDAKAGPYRVVHDGTSWVLEGRGYLDSYMSTRLNVIGNIYENPELLAKK